MCIIFWVQRSRGFGYRFIVAANRDEFLARPTKPADWWPTHPNVVAGMDMLPSVEGGTWLGITRHGKFAALTNYRVSESEIKRDAKGRGRLCTDFLIGPAKAGDYVESVSSAGTDFNSFSLLVSDIGTAATGPSEAKMYCYSNMESQGVKDLNGGVYGLCNRLVDSPWPKLVNGKKQFEDIVGRSDNGLSKEELIADLTKLMRDTQTYPDDQLPDTGVPIEQERFMSSIFLPPQEGYGTVSTAIILADDDDNVTFIEHYLDRTTLVWTTRTHDFKLVQ